MAKTRDVIVGLIIGIVGLLFIAVLIISVVALLKEEGSLLPGQGKVALVEISGIIESSEEIVGQLKKYARDPSVKAVILRIDSPGGQVAPTQEIYSQVMKLRESGKPVVTSMSSVAASGAYLIACAADTIFANPGTLTGSIGAIIDFYTIAKLMEKVGIEREVVKSGELKDVGTFARQMTEKERAMLQAAVSDVHEQFMLAVAEARNLDLDQVEEVADGSIFTGSQAQELGLVDKLGGLEDAISLAGKMAGLGERPRLVRVSPKRTRLLDYLTEKTLSALGLRTDSGWPTLQYLWR